MVLGDGRAREIIGRGPELSRNYSGIIPGGVGQEPLLGPTFHTRRGQG